jgi:hypothetical protein
MIIIIIIIIIRRIIILIIIIIRIIMKMLKTEPQKGTHKQDRHRQFAFDFGSALHREGLPPKTTWTNWI